MSSQFEFFYVSEVHTVCIIEDDLAGQQRNAKPVSQPDAPNRSANSMCTNLITSIISLPIYEPERHLTNTICIVNDNQAAMLSSCFTINLATETFSGKMTAESCCTLLLLLKTSSRKQYEIKTCNSTVQYVFCPNTVF